LGKNSEARQCNHQGLFDAHIDSRDLEDIRNATNKSWVLGTDHFKEQIEALTNRQAKPKAKDGDRKSKKYREGAGINRADSIDLE